MGKLYEEPTELECVCGHGRNQHSHYRTTSFSGEYWTICHEDCPCYSFTSTLEAAREYTKNLSEANKLKDLDENYKQFVSRNNCPKCGKGSHPTIAFHPNVSWFSLNKCRLGLRTEHIHLVCDLCKAHYSVKCLDKILDKLGVKHDGDSQR